MSIQSFKNFEEIIMYLSILRYIFKSRTKKGLYDLNKKAEMFFKDILNIIYGWNLSNLNSIQKNYKAIDLGDSEKKVCIQVTAENSSTKISKTITKFVEKELYTNYSRLIILIITDKKNYATQFKTAGKFQFSKTEDIKDIDDLLTDIETLQFEKLNELHMFLSKELSGIVSTIAEHNSLLARAEKKIELPPRNGEKLLVSLRYKDNEKKKGLCDLNEFYEILTNLPKPTREFLYHIVCKGSESYNSIAIQPRKLGSLLDIGDQRIIEELNILKADGIADCDDDYNDPPIEVYFSMDNGDELLSALKAFSKSEDTLREIIVDCDFTKLDAD